MQHLVGIPYRPDGRDESGCDCWGLIALYHRDVLGCLIPAYAGELTRRDEERHAVAALMTVEAARDWRPISGPERPGDVALMRRGLAACHVAVFIGNGMILHSEPHTGSIIERVGAPNVACRIVSWHRFARAA